MTSLREIAKHARNSTLQYLVTTLDRALLPELTEVVLRFVYGVPDRFAVGAGERLNMSRFRIEIFSSDYAYEQWFCSVCGGLYEETLWLFKVNFAWIKVSVNYRCCRDKKKQSSEEEIAVFKRELARLWLAGK